MAREVGLPSNANAIKCTRKTNFNKH